jgi:hypothetical protein
MLTPDRPQVEPWMNLDSGLNLGAPRLQRLQLNCVISLSNLDFNIKLRR